MRRCPQGWCATPSWLSQGCHPQYWRVSLQVTRAVLRSFGTALTPPAGHMLPEVVRVFVASISSPAAGGAVKTLGLPLRPNARVHLLNDPPRNVTLRSGVVKLQSSLRLLLGSL